MSILSFYNKRMKFRIHNNLGFTLVELLVVAIILGVLVTISVPFYKNAKETAVGGKALENLNAIRTAQITYQADHQTFSGDITTLQGYANFTDDDGDWTYAIDSAGADTFQASATRTGSSVFSGNVITIDETSTITYPGGASRYPP